MATILQSEVAQDEFTEKLTRLFEQDKSLAGIFSARCVLRILPLLAYNGNFAIWATREPKSADHLLAVFFSTLCGLRDSTKLVDIDPDYSIFASKKAENASHDISDMTFPFHLICLIASQAAIGSGSSAFITQADSLYAKIVDSTNYNDFFDFITATTFNDFRLIENKENPLHLPLWHIDISSSSFIKLYKSTWPVAIKDLAAEERHVEPETASLLQKMINLYQKIETGGNHSRTIEDFMLEVHDYLERGDEAKNGSISNPKPAKAKKAPSKKARPKESLQQGDAEPDKSHINKLTYTASRHQIAESISNQDSLNRQKLVNILAEFLAHPNNYHHLTIGLLGDWGVGKSSVVHLLKNRLLEKHNDQPFLFAEFNAWAYEHTNNLQAGIAQELVKALSSPDPIPSNTKRNLWKQLLWWMQRLKLIFDFALKLHAKKILKVLLLMLVAACPILGIESISEFFSKTAGQLTQTFTALSITAWITGFGFYFYNELNKIIATPLAKEFLTYLRLPDYGEHLGSIPVMRKHIEILCKVRLKTDTPTAKRLLFVVDDLDRCGPQGIVKVFEAVRLVLDIPNVMVIIAVDQRIALAAMALHYKDLAAHHQLENSRAIARDYLAKVIHLPIILKDPHKNDIQLYLNKIWDLSTSEDDKKRINDYRLTQTKHSTNVIGTPEENKNNIQEAAKTNIANAPVANNVAEVRTSNAEESHVEPTPTPPIASLTTEQKDSFVFWLDYFGLLNPRQVKRLNNCYNLLRSYYDEDVEFSSTKLNDDTFKDAKVFPLMLALFTMEYLNSLEAPEIRTQLKRQIFMTIAEITGETLADRKLSRDIIQTIQDASASLKVNLIDAVEPFVLPAIEKTFSNKSQP